jgi:acetyltransferase
MLHRGAARSAPAAWAGSVQPPPVTTSPVRVRRVQPQDAALLDALFQGLSPASRRLRFHGGVQQLPAAWLHRMVQPDAASELALLATIERDGREVCVGEARYARSDDAGDRTREFALVVADGWQGLGIGKVLLRSLGRHAARHGVRRLVGDVLHDNAPMIDLARRLGYTLRSHPSDARLLRAVRCFAAARPSGARASFETQAACR